MDTVGSGIGNDGGIEDFPEAQSLAGLPSVTALEFDQRIVSRCGNPCSNADAFDLLWCFALLVFIVE